MTASLSRLPRTVRTTDLSLAAYLVGLGYTPTHEVASDGGTSGHPQGAWVFDSEDGNIVDHVTQFEAGTATVDPAKYHVTINTTRRDMFKFLGLGKGK